MIKQKPTPAALKNCSFIKGFTMPESLTKIRLIVKNILMIFVKYDMIVQVNCYNASSKDFVSRAIFCGIVRFMVQRI